MLKIIQVLTMELLLCGNLEYSDGKDFVEKMREGFYPFGFFFEILREKENHKFGLRLQGLPLDFAA